MNRLKATNKLNYVNISCKLSGIKIKKTWSLSFDNFLDK